MTDNLIRMKTLVSAGIPLPPDLAVWVLNGISAFQNGHCKTLCGALGLRRAGQSSFATREKLQIRNACIIPIPINSYDNKAHFREHSFRTISGWLANVFHAWQHTSIISS